MKVILAGSRTITELRLLLDAITKSGFEITEVVSGMAPGVDRVGVWWADRKGIPVKRFYPDWKHLGKVAGIIRNQEMAKYADALIAVWDGKSRGTKHMIEYMRDKMMKPTFVWKGKRGMVE